MYEGDGDNSGTETERVSRCSEACLSKKSPGGSWTDFEAKPLLQQLAGDIQNQLNKESAEIAHLKMTLSPDSGLGGHVAIINLVRNDFVPELSADLDGPIESGQLIINLRAESDPDALRAAVETAIANVPDNLTAKLDHLEHFRPGKPEPTHRITDLV